MLRIVQDLQIGNVNQLSISFVLTINRGSISIGADTKSILLAEEVIAINQDPLGVPGDLIWKQGPNEVWHVSFSRCLDCGSCRMRCTPCVSCALAILTNAALMWLSTSSFTTPEDQAAVRNLQLIQPTWRALACRCMRLRCRAAAERWCCSTGTTPSTRPMMSL